MRRKIFAPYIIGAVAALFLILGGVIIWRQNLLPTEGQEPTEGSVFGAFSLKSPRLPSDIPLFEPAETISSTETAATTQVTLETENSRTAVESFYQERLGEEGWKETEAGIYKKNQRRLEISLAAQDEEKTIIVLTYTKN